MSRDDRNQPVPGLLAHDGPLRGVPDEVGDHGAAAAPTELRYRRGRRRGADVVPVKQRRQENLVMPVRQAREELARELAQDRYDGPWVNEAKREALLKCALLDVVLYGPSAVFPDVPKATGGVPDLGNQVGKKRPK